MTAWSSFLPVNWLVPTMPEVEPGKRKPSLATVEPVSQTKLGDEVVETVVGIATEPEI